MMSKLGTQDLNENAKRIGPVWLAVLCAITLGFFGSACLGVESTVEMPAGEEGSMPVDPDASEGDAADEVSDEPADEDMSDGSSEGLTESALANLSYQVDGTEVPLVDGIYQEKPMPDSATFIANYSLGPWQVFGDLDGDGMEDAAVVLIDAPGGSGVFTYLAAVVDGDDGPRNVATTSLGDRPQIEEVRVEDGTVVVVGKTHGPDDAMCCPSQDFEWGYRLVGGELVRE